MNVTMTVYSVDEAAAEFYIDRNTVYRDIRTGRLKAVASKGKFEAQPEDYEEYRKYRIAKESRTFPRGNCSVCGAAMRRSRFGICAGTPECRTARSRAQEPTRVAKKREYRQANRAKLKVAHDAYMATEEAFAGALITNCRKRAKVRGTACTITKWDILPAIKAGVCQHPACGRTLRRRHDGHARVDSFTIDEIIPGRGYLPGNWALLCRACNTKKSDSSIAWLQATVEMMARSLAGEWPPNESTLSLPPPNVKQPAAVA